MNRYYKFLSWMVAIFVVMLFLSGVLYKSLIGAEITATVMAYGFLGLFVLVFLLDFIPQYFSPYMILMSALLFGLDPFAACLVSIVASVLASLSAFGIGAGMSAGFVKDVINGGVRRKKNSSNHHLTSRIINGWGKWVVLLTALTPLPYFPMLFGALRMKKDNFYLFGVLPRIIGFIIITLFVAFVF